MAFRAKKQVASLDEIFEFSAGGPEFDLVDIETVESDSTAGQGFDKKHGEFIYETKIFVNEKRAAELGVTGLTFDVFTKDPSKYKVYNTDALETFTIQFDSATDALLKVGDQASLSAKQVSVPRNSTKQILSNITPFVGTQIGLSPVPQKSDLGNFLNASAVAKKKGLDPAALVAIGNFASTSPNFAVSLDSTSTAGTKDESAKKTIKKKKGPTKSFSKFKSALKKAKKGNQNNDLVKALVQTSPVFLGNLNSGIVSAAATVAASLPKLSPVTTFEFLPLKKEYTYKFGIDKILTSGEDRLFVRVSPAYLVLGAKKIAMRPKIVSIPHGDAVAELLENPEPPEVSIKRASISSVSLKIKREDPTLDRVRVHRIITNPYFINPVATDVKDIFFSDPTYDNQGQFVQDEILFEDAVDNVLPNRVTYRVCVINPGGSVGQFSSVVIPAVKKMSDPLKSTGVSAAIRALNTRDGAQVRVNILTKDIFSFRLLRQEIKKVGTFADSVVTVTNNSDNETNVVGNTDTSFNFVDRTAILGRKYRYFLAYRLGNTTCQLGEELLSDEDELLIRRYPTVDLPFSFGITTPSIQTDSFGSANVSFAIEVQETKELFNLVNTALTQAGVGAEFLQKLAADNTKAKQILLFLIERVDSVTGKRVEMGIFPAGDFSDSKALRNAKGIPDPIPGRKYEYVVKACLQQPDVFLQRSTVGVTADTGTVFQKKAARFTRYVYNQLGVMPPENEVLRGTSIEKLLLESQLGLEEVSGEIKIPEFPSPKITMQPIVKKTNYSKITWSATQTNSISYFQVFGKMPGCDTSLLGAVACPNQSELFSFEDDRNANEIGDITYEIRAVGYNDDNLATEEKAFLLGQLSIPDNSVEGYVYFKGPDGKQSSTYVQNVEDLKKFSQIQGALASAGYKNQDIQDLGISAYQLNQALGSTSASANVASADPVEFWAGMDLPSFSGKQKTGMPQSNKTPDASSVFSLGFKAGVEGGSSFAEEFSKSTANKNKEILQKYLDSIGVSSDGNLETFEAMKVKEVI